MQAGFETGEYLCLGVAVCESVVSSPRLRCGSDQSREEVGRRCKTSVDVLDLDFRYIERNI